MIVLDVDIKSAGYNEAEHYLQDVKFSIHHGELVGLIGANGAGKSTTIKGVLGYLPSMKGDINVSGQHTKMSYVPEYPVLYEGLTLWEHLELTLAVYQLYDDHHIARCHQLLDLFQLTEHLHEIPTTFSKGMQQKVMLIVAFLIKPDVYIIDEPFIGLDPVGTRTLISLIEEEKKRGAAILMSSHVLDTAQRLCDSFILLKDGRLEYSGTLQQFRTHCSLPEGSLADCFDYFSRR